MKYKYVIIVKIQVAFVFTWEIRLCMKIQFECLNFNVKDVLG